MIRTILVSIALLAAVGCTGTEEIDNKPAAQVTEPAPKPEPKVEEPKAPEFVGAPVEVDAANSKIEFLGAKVTNTHDGGFKNFKGKAYVDGEAVTGAEFSVDLASLWTDTEKLTNHLKTDDFFDVEKFTEATFVSTKVVAKEGEGATHEVTGELDLHGVKKELTFPATIAVAADAVKVTSEFKINRMDWGLKYPGKPDDLIKEEVAIKLDLSFPREAAAAGETPAAPAGAPAPKDAPAKSEPLNPDGPAKKGAPAPAEGGAKKGGEKKAAPTPTEGASKGGAKKGGEKK
ncbi:MAG: YceI family protein [Alphaproteobacteria bacterium]|nr:YceI family protein [Alphaproteobacteria bacterium]